MSFHSNKKRAAKRLARKAEIQLGLMLGAALAGEGKKVKTSFGGDKVVTNWSKVQSGNFLKKSGNKQPGVKQRFAVDGYR